MKSPELITGATADERFLKTLRVKEFLAFWWFVTEASIACRASSDTCTVTVSCIGTDGAPIPDDAPGPARSWGCPLAEVLEWLELPKKQVLAFTFHVSTDTVARLDVEMYATLKPVEGAKDA